MKKNKIKNILIFLGKWLLLNLVIGSIVGGIIYYNYKEWTASKSGISKNKIIVLKEIKEEKIKIKKENKNNKNILYEGPFGKITHNIKNIKSEKRKVNIDSFYFDIKDKKINDFFFLSVLASNNLLDKFIKRKIKENNKKEILEDIINNFLLLKKKGINKDSGKTILNKYSSGVLNIKKEISKNINNDRYDELSFYLENKEKEIINNIKENEKNNLLEKNSLITDKNFQNVLKKITGEEYKKKIEEVSSKLKIDPKLIYSVIAVEQIRYLVTYRGYAKYQLKSKYLVNFSKFSYGLGGIKIDTFKKINKWMKKYNKDLYNKYFKKNENLTNTQIQKVLEGKDGLLYVGGLIYSIKEKWREAGFPIDDKPGIIITLYNMGNNKNPRKNPDLGGSYLKINKDYKLYFGELGSIFYFYLKYYVF